MAIQSADAVSGLACIDVEAFPKDIVAAGKSKFYISKIRGMMFQIMNKAEANELIIKNPVAVADKIKTADPEPSKKIPSLRLPMDRMGSSIRFILGTGMHNQKITALQQT